MKNKSKVIPSCNLCNKMNAEMTHCAIYGFLPKDSINNTALAAGCVAAGDYVRLIHAIPNQYNLGKKIDSPVSDLRIYSESDERNDFQNKHGISLEDWVQQTFGDNEK